MNQVLRAWLPFEVIEKATRGGVKQIRLRGIASTEHPDQQGDTILQSGLDCSPLLKHGWFNDDHSKRTADVLGYPDRVYPIEITDGDGKPARGTAIEGYLLDTPEAQRIVALAKALEGTDRQLGLSLEGDILERDRRDRHLIRRAVVRNVAITNCPVNPNTTLSLAKSVRMVEALRKGVTAGSGQLAHGVPVAGDLRPMMPESLGLRLTIDPGRTAEELDRIAREWRAANGGPLTKSQAIHLIRRRLPQASRADALRVLRLGRLMGDKR